MKVLPTIAYKERLRSKGLPVFELQVYKRVGSIRKGKEIQF